MHAAHNRFLTAESTKEQKRLQYIAVRIATDPNGAFVCGSFIREHDQQPTDFSSIEEWITLITARAQRGHIWYAHHGGEQDYKYLIPAFFDWSTQEEHRQTKPIVRGNVQCIGFVMSDGHHSYHLRDSFALLPDSLEKITRSFAPQYDAEPLHLTGGETFNPDNPDHMASLHTEVLALRQALIVFDALLMEHFDVHPQWTAASTALKAWRRTIPPDRVYIRPRPEVEELCADAKAGGLTLIRDRKLHEDVVSLDINGSYAAAMREGVPVGAGSYTSTYIPDAPGIYRVIAHVPKATPMTFIPCRTPEGIRYPTGDFHATITSKEIDFAVERGITFDMLGGFVWTHTEPIFDQFVNQCEALELVDRKSALGLTIKYMRNGLPGKFGTNKEQHDYVIMEEPPEGYAFVIDPLSEQLQIVDFLWAADTIIEKACMQYHWSAWISATGRLALVRLCEAVGHQHVLYGDTDAVYVTRAAYADAVARHAVDMGPHYGQVKVDHEWLFFNAIAPKSYYGELTDGTVIRRAKGLPAEVLTTEKARAAARGEAVTVTFTAQTGTVQIIKGAPRNTTPTERTWGTMAAATAWEEDERDTYKPKHLRE